jgi:glutamate dehydrogenase
MAPEGLERRLPRARPERVAVLDGAAALLRRRLPGAAGEEATRFLSLWAAGVPDEDLAARSPEDVAGAALSLLDHARSRTPGQASVRVFNPRPEAEGWRSPHSIAEIVNDDMPFLVDSALAGFAIAGRAVHLVVHPIVPAQRDAQGRLVAFGDGAGPDAPRESMMQIEFAQGADSAELATVAAALKRAMADVRAAVADWPAMRARLAEAIAALEGTEDEEARIAREFLAWLADDNLVLLGYRRYRPSDGGIEAETEQSLGLLRDASIPVFDVLRDPANLPPAVRAWAAEPTLLTVAKANMRATVHRPQHCDAIVVKRRGADGAVTGAEMFLGLFASNAYNRNPRSIPYLREKLAAVLAAAGVDPNTHDGRRLSNILETYPRDELFQAGADELLATARGVLALQERQRVALFPRRDRFERFVSAIVYVPRDVMDTKLRARIGEAIAEAFEGRLSTAYILIGDSPLARVHYIIATNPGAVPEVDVRGIERALAEIARSFRERLAEALIAEKGEAGALAVLGRWGEAFPTGYAERRTAREAVADIALAEAAIAAGTLQLALARPQGAAPWVLALRVAHPDRPVPLSDILPLIESLGLRAIEEVPHHLRPGGPGARSVVLHEFMLETEDHAAFDPARAGSIADALAALWQGHAEPDGFNRLVVRAGLTWRESWMLRALYRWLKQVGFAFSQGAVEAAFAAQTEAARLLTELFHARFDPERPRDPAAEAAIDARWRTLLDAVESPDEDRILTRMRQALDGVVRTSFFRDEAAPTIAFKIDSRAVGDLPQPLPFREIFVHGARMEGVHLRGGPVARGGIRWSDRREDFRTEILGLMKAQTLKNTVIVPTGAKGGFVLKRPPAPTGDPARDREALQAEGIACYRLLIGAMLDLTDNRVAGKIVPPERVVRRDQDDPYIVAAADKGTATFSDIANGIALERGFWLGDAFASGGSKGYDHKGLGITARGAFVCIRRHFRELGVDIDRDPIDVVGVGDMSGDVFGNGVLLSKAFRLRAAFDHRHIFLDPDPDPAVSWQERSRMFALPRSSWADYDVSTLSAGGGVHPRNAKTVPLSAEARAMLGIEAERATPDAVMRAILTMQADLLYFGGIGTFVKANHESHADAGDRANDAIRVNARDLRARVVGEGANLGLTQAARVEAAQAGLRVDTDSLHNSAGVDTSDHEVNLKILLDLLVQAGDLTAKQRDALLVSVTEDVAAHVLATNARQSLGVSLEQMGTAVAGPHAGLIARLESESRLDRGVAGLPDAASLAERGTAGLTRPELIVLLSYAKLWLTDALIDSPLPDDPAFAPDLSGYFPPAVRERFGAAIAAHPLRRDLVAMLLTNDLLDRMGLAAFARLADGIAPEAAAMAALIAREALGLEPIRAAAEAEDAAGGDPAVLYPRFQAWRRAQEGAARGFVRALTPDLRIADAAGSYRDHIDTLLPVMLERDPSGGAAAMAPAILRLSAEAGTTPSAGMEAWFAAGAGLGPDAVRAAARQVEAVDGWTGRALASVADDLNDAQARLAAAVLALGGVEAVRAGAGARWVAAERVLAELGARPGLPAVVVATRAVAALA